MKVEDSTLVQADDLQAQSQELSLGLAVPTLPGYLLHERLGQGSFGEVWAGVQVRTGQTVAIKLFTGSTSLNWQYLEHEVTRLRRVAEHANIVTLLDADLQHQPPYFVMSLHERSLQGWTALQAGGIEQVLIWFEQMARALHYTHARGLLHCDMKPSNVLLDQENCARVSDFGQSVGRGQPAKSLGSLGYMGPEQASQGTIPEVSWDVYSLGATVYTLLTGQVPRLDEQARAELATSSDSGRKLERYITILESRPLIPVRQLNHAVDADLAAIVECCLRLDPASRTPDMGQILEDLKRRRQQRTLLCRQPWSWSYRAGRFLLRHKVGSALVVLALLVLGAVDHERVLSQRRAALLSSRQGWEQGWTQQRQGREPLAMLWWAREAEEDPDYLLAPGAPSAKLLSFEKKSEPACTLAYTQDGRLLVSTPSLVQWGQQQWQKSTGEPTDDHGPYRVPRPSAGLIEGNQVVARLGGQLQLLGAPLQSLGECRGTVVTGAASVLFSDGQQLRVYQNGTTTKLSDSNGPLLVGAVGRRWVARAVDNRIELWDLRSGHKVDFAGSHDQAINWLALSPDGTQLVSAGEDKKVRTWSLPGGRQVLPEIVGDMAMLHAAFSPDGATLVTCNYNGAVRLWRASDHTPICPPLKHRWMVYSCSFSPSGQRFVTNSIDGSARVWETATGKPVSPFLEHGSPVRLAALTADGSELATAALDGSLRRFSLQPDPRQRTLQSFREKAVCAALYPDGRRALVALNSELQLWDLSSGRLLQSQKVPDVLKVARISADGKLLVTAGTVVQRWDPATLEPLGSAWQSEGEVQSGQISRDARFFVGGTENGAVECWDLLSGQVNRWKTQSVRVASLEFSPDGQRLVTSSFDRSQAAVAELREFPSGQLLATLKHPGGLGIARALFSPDGARILTCGEEGTGLWWDGRNGRELPVTPLRHSLGIWDAAFAPNGQFVVTGSGDSTLQVFDLNGRRLIPPLQHDGPVVRVQISADSRRIVSSSKDGSARLWSASSGEPLLAPVQHSDMVFVCRISADDQQLLTAADDGSIKLTDLSACQLSADQLAQRVQKWTGLRLVVDDGGVPRVGYLTPEEWKQIP